MATWSTHLRGPCLPRSGHPGWCWWLCVFSPRSRRWWYAIVAVTSACASRSDGYCSQVSASSCCYLRVGRRRQRVSRSRVAFLPFLLAIVVLVPVAVGIAGVRYDLYDVDRLLSDSAAWALTLVCPPGCSARSCWWPAVLSVPLLDSARLRRLSQPRWCCCRCTESVAASVARIIDRDRQVAIATVERFAADVRVGRREPEEVEDVLRDAQRDPGLRLYLRPFGRRLGAP